MVALIHTLEDDDEFLALHGEESSDSESETKSKKKQAKNKKVAKGEEAWNDDFAFRPEDNAFAVTSQSLGEKRMMNYMQTKRSTIAAEGGSDYDNPSDADSDSDEISDEEEDVVEGQGTTKEVKSTKKVQSKKPAVTQEVSEAKPEHHFSDSEEEESESDSDDDTNGTKDHESVQSGSSQQKKSKKDSFFSKAPELASVIDFQDMNLSRHLLRAVTSIGYVTPTPIQSKVIPLALMAKDICACASTGSGKTAAFMLPVLERLMYRPRNNPATRVLVLEPTRELAAQCRDVAVKLAQFTDVTFSLIVGGVADKSQKVELRNRPDVIIATPGRLIDHVHNTQSFDLQSIEVLIMDEADRLLELGFRDEVDEIVRKCPKGRQTMLISATMTDEVDQLANLSLHQPIRLFIDKNTDTADNLIQEFIRVRKAKEGDRDAILLALCKRSFKTKTIIFFRSKAAAHRMKVIFDLVGISGAELHGNLTQLQRLESLDKFKHGEVDFLLATDLAGRGLDIVGVDVVINFTMPHNLTQYIHRVGRTARAGRKGRAVTLVGEGERALLKEVVNSAKVGVLSRVVPATVVDKYRARVQKMSESIKEVMLREKEERMMDVAERDANKAQNLIKHETEIFSRPARQWFQTMAGKQASKEQGKKAYEGRESEDDDEPEAESAAHHTRTDSVKVPLGDMSDLKDIEKRTGANRAQKRKMAASMDEDGMHVGLMGKAVRDAKKQKRTPRLTMYEEEVATKNKRQQGKNAKTWRTVGFENDLTDTSKKNVQALRSSGSAISDHGARKLSKRDADTKKASDKSEKQRRLKELRSTKGNKQFKSKKKHKRR
ncbi:hypothetical protein SARC_00820 [Sphaeroforma arctica JP610]|uniref:RNA helicase n=1 Tax=Sphaeroforma arctica JP610 TaxID=667725 RepID=A0A0L0GDY1_9EUKA|nr:hypothetical protein SARC_00820 [Sphaeroforma arctica JP610]KNC87076.1 hypothetical protein SARC_00820 [Sphaeroforma arctica JP610]|eukprot:XP_014160978.1 hypothetical protein SARC_00820 [Sphaeroforma arctica JP610]